MTARVSRDFAFDAGTHTDNAFVINHYQMTLNIDVYSDNIREQNIALERIKYIIEVCLENSVLVRDTHTSAIAAYQAAGLKVCSLPEEPYDQIVAAVLLSKLNVVTEDKVAVTDITIVSKLCDGVNFIISQDEVASFSNKVGVWWTENSPAIISHLKKERAKIVEMKKDCPGWTELGLTWKDQEISNNEITFSTDKT
jgi:hypothetical protein